MNPKDLIKDPIVKDLMIHVERIVRPVRADHSKMRMRRELLAHLQSAYEEERARGLDESAALAAAKGRLGDSSEITRQLQASVSRWERLSVTPSPRWLGTIPIIIAVLVPLIIAIVPPPAWLTGQPLERTSTSASASLARDARFAHAAAALALELYVFLSTFCIVIASSIAVGTIRRHWFWIVVFGSLLLPLQLLWNLFLPLVLGELAPSAFTLTAALVGFAILLSLIPLPVHQWRSLDIAE